jgi:hypothetical protein
MSPVNNEFKMASGKCAFLDLAACSRRGEGKGEGLFNEAKRVLQSSMNYLYRHLYHLDFTSLRVFNGSRMHQMNFGKFYRSSFTLKSDVLSNHY